MKDISPEIKTKIPFKAYFGVSDIQGMKQELINQLSDGEKEELALYTNLKRQREYLSTRLALKKLASHYKIDVSQFCICKDELGQPYGQVGDQRYFASIAHTDDRAFCGLSKKHAIGVDLEPVDRNVPELLLSRIMHPSEETLITEIETIRLWTIKEAYIKLRGQGLRLNMNQVPIRRIGDNFQVEFNNDKSAKICSFRMETSWFAIAFYQ